MTMPSLVFIPWGIIGWYVIPETFLSYSGWAVAVKSDTHEGQRNSVAFFHFSISRCVRNKVQSSSSAISPPDDSTEGIQILLEILGQD